MSILVIGSVALDTLKTPQGSRKEILGGSASYFSMAARHFRPVRVVAVIGSDFPKKHLVFLSRKGIDLRGLEIVQGGKTFRWHGEYGLDCNCARTLKTQLNVFADFRPKLPRDFEKSEFVFLANIDPDLQHEVLAQVKHPKLVAFDSMNYWIANKQRSLLQLLQKVDIFLLNDSEARQLSGENNLLKAGKHILTQGPRWVVIKKGEHGAILFSKNHLFCVPAFLLETVVDPTGAGDTFAGGFMGYLASQRIISDLTLRNAIIYGNIIASFTVEGFGLERLGRVTKVDIKRRLKEFCALIKF